MSKGRGAVESWGPNSRAWSSLQAPSRAGLSTEGCHGTAIEPRQEDPM